MAFTNGRTLRNVIKSSTYRKLSDYCSRIGLPLAQLEIFKPGMLSVTLTALELQRLGLIGTGVDEHYFSRAKADGKSTGQLESVEQQIDLLANMGEGEEDELILYTLREVDKLQGTMATLKSAWRNGDMVALEAIGIEPLITRFPTMYRQLLSDRNNAWIPQIEAMIATPEQEFVLVGALHMAGRDGLINQLIARGYSVDQL